MKKNSLISKFDDAMFDAAQNDNDFLDAFLVDNGYNLSEINETAERSFKKHSFIIKGVINKQKDEIRLAKSADFLKRSIHTNYEKPVHYFKELLRNNKFAIQYRNLDELNIEEIKQITQDQNLLEILEQMEDEE